MSVEPNGSTEPGLKPSNGSLLPSERLSSDPAEKARLVFPSQTPVHRAEQKAANEPGAARKVANANHAPDGDLVACAGVKLKGEIVSCNALMVEGDVEGQLSARQLVIANGGSFVGRAEVDEPEIAGRFEGTLRVLGKLCIRRSGSVHGHIGYGQIEIEAGGELRGRVDVQFGEKKSFIAMPTATKFWKA